MDKLKERRFADVQHFENDYLCGSGVKTNMNSDQDFSLFGLMSDSENMQKEYWKLQKYEITSCL